AIGNAGVVVGDGGGSPWGGVSAREALLGVLGKLYQQCSVYLAPCQGDPLLERMMPSPPPRGARTEARVQLQLMRREERALKAVVQPEVRTYLLLRSILWQLAAIAEGLRPDVDDNACSAPSTPASRGNSGGAATSKRKPDAEPTANPD
ncbi:unnamed protein product, partial [Laminaria digitata]